MPKPPDPPSREPSTRESYEEELKSSGVKRVDVAALRSKIGSLMQFSAFEPEQRYWLETAFPDLHIALGGKRGLPYGKIYELWGPEHGGKTTIATVLAGIAQREGAAVIYIDLEDSRDAVWARKLGLDFENVVPIYPKLIKAKKKIKKGSGKGKTVNIVRLQGAEEIFAEAEAAMQLLYENGFKKMVCILDSVANLSTTMAVEAGTMDRNMRVNVDRAQFLSNTLPMWAGLASNYNAMILLINQQRDKVGVVFGDPRYAPGGRALKHSCAVRAYVARKGNGKIRFNGKVVGIHGRIENTKNKAGAGSVEGREVHFKIRWDKKPARIRFMTAAEAEEE